VGRKMPTASNREVFPNTRTTPGYLELGNFTAMKATASIVSAGSRPGRKRVKDRQRWSLAAAIIVWGVADQGRSSCATEPNVPQAPPANVFIPTLPECSPIRSAKPVRKASERLLDKKVAMRGLLTFGGNWICRCSSCVTSWRVVDARADLLSGPTPALLIERREQTSRGDRWQINASVPLPVPPDLDVIAIGILRRTDQGSVDFDDFLLEDAELCRVRTDPMRPSKPLTHPPVSIFAVKVDCGADKL
jgi:hypothetical protein